MNIDWADLTKMSMKELIDILIKCYNGDHNAMTFYSNNLILSRILELVEENIGREYYLNIIQELNKMKFALYKNTELKNKILHTISGNN